jgi:AcrR family transcriptional regulator/DNA-binding MarR family transcriptional regulator
MRTGGVRPEDADRSKIGQRRPSPSSGGVFVLELQRARLLDATFAVVGEAGYRGMAVRAVTERAGISSKTFYDLFADREDCFLAAFDHGVDRLAAVASPAYAAEKDWAASIRAGLGALLGFLDGEPALRTLVFVEALGAGPRVLARRAEVLQEIAAVVDEGRVGMKGGGELPLLTGEGVVGAAFGLIHTRLLQPRLGPSSGLLNELMATIVLPYRGRAAAARQLKRLSAKQVRTFGRPISPALAGRPHERPDPAPPLGSLKPVDFRLTVRTQTVLKVVGECPGLSNQRVSELAGISDQGQISRLMMRLAEQGLVENVRAGGQGAPKAWWLTGDGEALIQAEQPPLRNAPSVTADFRLTVRTYMVLATVAELREWGSDPSNRQISDAAGVTDQGQISKLLARLESHGLLVNTGGATAGVPNAWRLTPQGEEIVSLSSNRGASVPSVSQEEMVR